MTTNTSSIVDVNIIKEHVAIKWNIDFRQRQSNNHYLRKDQIVNNLQRRKHKKSLELTVNIDCHCKEQDSRK